jgi:hypothetical protein
MVTHDSTHSPGMRRALAAAQALIDAGLATETLVQDGRVYSDAACAGCGTKRNPNEVDSADNAGNPWCPMCGGRSLVALDQTPLADFENGLCRVSTSRVVHSVALPNGQHPLCMPGCKVGRMRPANKDTEVTCERCIKARAGEADYGINLDSEAIPLSPTSVGER